MLWKTIIIMYKYSVAGRSFIGNSCFASILFVFFFQFIQLSSATVNHTNGVLQTLYLEHLQEHYANNNSEYSLESIDRLMNYNGLHSNHEAAPHGDHDSHVEASDHHDDDHDDHDDDHDKIPIHNATELFEMFNITGNATQDQFLNDILPAIVAMVESQSVEAEDDHHDSPHGDEETRTLSKGKIWGYSIVATVIVSIIGFSGIMLLPFITKGKDPVKVRYFLTFIICLGIGTLVSDAFMHLIPEGFGLHSHGHDDHGDHGHHEESSEMSHGEVLARGITVLAGIYFLYLIENILATFGNPHSHSMPSLASTSTSRLASKEEGSAEKSSLEPQNAHSLENGVQDTAIAVNEEEVKQSSTEIVQAELDQKKLPWYKRCTTVAWVVLIGDGFHNMVDGIAIGASFSISVSVGISTTIAVILHEIPQELSDFGILTMNGLTNKEALLTNFVSGCTTFLGLAVGIESGTESVSWIVLFTAGQFLYIALFDMLSQISHSVTGNKFIYSLMCQLGFFSGFTIMLLIGLYGENISV